MTRACANGSARQGAWGGNGAMMDTEQKREVNRRLAAFAGWIVVPRKVSPLYDVPGDTVFDLYTPDGKRTKMRLTEAEAWDGAPDFAASVDAVLDTLPYEWEIMLEHGSFSVEWVACIAHMTKDAYYGEGATRAEALAAARLAMAQAQGGEHG